MKAVSNNKRRYSYKDIIRVFILTSGHYFFFLSYLFFILLIKTVLVDHGIFLKNITFLNKYLIYSIFFAPIISVACHVSYAELGSPWLRFFMWLHGMVNFIYIPIILLIVI